MTKDDTQVPPPDQSRERPQPSTPLNQQAEQTLAQKISEPFTNDEKNKLLDIAHHILQVEPSLEDKAWAEFAENNVRRTMALNTHFLAILSNDIYRLSMAQMNGRDTSTASSLLSMLPGMRSASRQSLPIRTLLPSRGT